MVSIIRNYFSRIGYDTFEWLKIQEHSPYNYKERLGYVLTTLFLLALSIVGFILFYTNAEKLSSINIWFIRLLGVLLIIALFFIIKYGYRLLAEIINWVKRQKNWLKYLIIIFLLFFLWQVYLERETALNPLFETYHKINFPYFNPLVLGFGDDNPKAENSLSRAWDNLKDITTIPKEDYPIVESKILELVNQERAKYGSVPLKSNANLDSYARSWSEKMITENFFEHSKLNFNYASIAGENIAETPLHSNVVGCGSTYGNEAMARCFVSGWIKSPGHHENMISRSFSMTGIGIACDSSKCRATQVFSG